MTLPTIKKTLGILSLDTAFPRIFGDVGNPNTYPFHTLIEVIEGAGSVDIVQDGSINEQLLQKFEDGAQRLVSNGANAIISTCGFLVSAQDRIAATVGVPVLLSALTLYPYIQSTCPGKVGILTASKAALGSLAFQEAKICADDVVVAGLEDQPLFRDTFLVEKQHQSISFDRAEMQALVVTAAIGLKATHPDLSALILECGNLPPYAQAIRDATDLPIFHMADAAHSLVLAK